MINFQFTIYMSFEYVETYLKHTKKILMNSMLAVMFASYAFKVRFVYRLGNHIGIVGMCIVGC